MPGLYDNAPDDHLIDEILALEEQADLIDSKLKAAKRALLERKMVEITEALKAKPEPFGAVSQVIGGFKVTFTTPKKVEWDQDGLRQLREQMIADNANPDEYIQMDLRVKEDAYKNWPSNLKEYFEPHRTIKPGSVSMKIEPVKE